MHDWDHINNQLAAYLHCLLLVTIVGRGQSDKKAEFIQKLRDKLARQQLSGLAFVCWSTPTYSIAQRTDYIKKMSDTLTAKIDNDDETEKWSCEYCTYENFPSSLKCTMCMGQKPLLNEDIFRWVFWLNNLTFQITNKLFHKDYR